MNTLLVSLLALFATLGSSTEPSEQEAIKKVITSFAQAGDNNDANALEKTLDDNYRIVMNRLFGSDVVSIMSKDTYLAKIESKEYGGDHRKITFETITVNGTSASAQVKFSGEELTFVSIITLVKDSGGYWKLVSEIPMIG